MSLIYFYLIFFLHGVDIFILVTIENTFLMYLVILLFNLEYLNFINMIYRFNILLFFLSLFLLSYTTSNIGIAIRQKWIFLPSLIIFMAAIKFKNSKILNNFDLYSLNNLIKNYNIINKDQTKYKIFLVFSFLYVTSSYSTKFANLILIPAISLKRIGSAKALCSAGLKFT